MPNLVHVERFGLIRVSAKVSGDSAALITMAYVNQKAPNENFVLGPTSEINKLMVFDEVGFHSLAFVAVGTPTGEQGDLSVALANAQEPDPPLYESGALPFEEGHAHHEVRIMPE